LGQVVRADDEVEVRDPREELLALLLRDAARDREDEAGVLRLQRRELADLAPQLLLGLLADAAGIEDDDVDLVRRLGAGPAVRAQRLLHAVGVVRVHLEAEGVDEIASHARLIARDQGNSMVSLYSTPRLRSSARRKSTHGRRKPTSSGAKTPVSVNRPFAS